MSENVPTLWNADSISQRIYDIRNTQVMFDKDLAEIYGVETKVFNQAIKRNLARFPEKFMFQLSSDEFDYWTNQMDSPKNEDSLRSQIVTLKKSKRGRHRKYFPYVFTEQGVAMLSAVLRSQTAIEISLQIMDAFVEMRRFLQNNAQVFLRFESLEHRQIHFEAETHKKFDKIFQALEQKETPKQGIFYDGQVYDAYTFASDLIRKAKKSVVLIDNYVDDSVLTLFTKRKPKVKFSIYTKKISKTLSLDLKKHNEQYPEVTIKRFPSAHDRFLIIDEKEIYHIGASLKDLGKKWFAFSKFESGAVEMLRKLGETNGGK